LIELFLKKFFERSSFLIELFQKNKNDGQQYMSLNDIPGLHFPIIEHDFQMGDPDEPYSSRCECGACDHYDGNIFDRVTFRKQCLFINCVLNVNLK